MDLNPAGQGQAALLSRHENLDEILSCESRIRMKLDVIGSRWCALLRGGGDGG